MNLDDLQDLTDLFEYKELTQKSKANQKDVDELVKTQKKVFGKEQSKKQRRNEIKS